MEIMTDLPLEIQIGSCSRSTEFEGVAALSEVNILTNNCKQRLQSAVLSRSFNNCLSLDQAAHRPTLANPRSGNTGLLGKVLNCLCRDHPDV